MDQDLNSSSSVRARAGVRYSVGDQGVRPWGTWEVLAVGQQQTVKRIVVLPGQRLSLQYHRFRAEHRTVVEGVAVAEIGASRIDMKVGSHADIEPLTCQRIMNSGTAPLTFVEVQYGSLLDEADIVRIEDDYGRNLIH